VISVRVCNRSLQAAAYSMGDRRLSTGLQTRFDKANGNHDINGEPGSLSECSLQSVKLQPNPSQMLLAPHRDKHERSRHNCCRPGRLLRHRGGSPIATLWF